MRKNRISGLTLVELIVGLAISLLIALGAFGFMARFTRATTNLAKKTAAQDEIDELMRSLKTLWAGRGTDNIANCNCPAIPGPDSNCPSKAGGPCPSHKLLTTTGIPGCQGLRLFKPIIMVGTPPAPQFEFRDFLTSCDPSALPPGVGPVPAPVPVCAAGRPLISRRTNINGAPRPPQLFPGIGSVDLVAGSLCVTLNGTDYVVQLNAFLSLVGDTQVIQRRLVLSTLDKTAGVEYMGQ